MGTWKKALLEENLTIKEKGKKYICKYFMYVYVCVIDIMCVYIYIRIYITLLYDAEDIVCVCVCALKLLDLRKPFTTSGCVAQM